MAGLADPDAGGFAAEIWPYLAEAAEALFPPPAAEPLPGAAEGRLAWLRPIAAALEIPRLDLLARAAAGAVCTPADRTPPALLVDVKAAPDELAFWASRALALLALRAGALDRKPAADLAPLFSCAAVLAGGTVPKRLPKPGEAMLRDVSRLLSRKDRKALALQASRFGFEPLDLDAWRAGVLRVADRFAMLVLGDPARAAAARAGGVAAVASDAAAREMLAFALSETYVTVRRAAGPRGGNVSGRGPRSPGEPAEVTTIEIDDDFEEDFDERFEDAPPTDPNVPALADLDPRRARPASPRCFSRRRCPRWRPTSGRRGWRRWSASPSSRWPAHRRPRSGGRTRTFIATRARWRPRPRKRRRCWSRRAARRRRGATRRRRRAATTKRWRARPMHGRAAGSRAVGREPGRARRSARAVGAAGVRGRYRGGAGVLRRAVGGMDAGPPRDSAGRGVDAIPPGRRAPSRWRRRRCAKGPAPRPARGRGRPRAEPGQRADGPAAAGRPTGRIGAAFIEQAARVALTARDANAAAAYLAAARRLAPAEPGIPLAALGGAARATGRDAEKKLAEVLPGLPARSPVTEAVRRWGAGLARARGDLPAARAFLDDEPAGLAAARDRIELDAAMGAPLTPQALERARTGAGSPAAAATLTWVEAQALRRQGENGAVTTLLAAAVDAAPDATPLAVLAEATAGDARGSRDAGAGARDVAAG